ncbi:hypothetical protein ACIP9X_10690 [Arthrobacter sp. NPDC093125]|uniref:hypothetical protein n=1 Tax=Arthrobacter sp. NPDC093125 TaxID=3363944 RepID=UPI00380EFE17
MAVPAATPSPSSTTSAPTFSAPAESGWTTPIGSAAEPTQAAVVSAEDNGPGVGIFGLLVLMGGVLLVGLGGLAFAFWIRNRLASHW